MKLDVLQSQVCAGGKLCAICRAEHGVIFRQGLLTRQIVDAERFDCPSGLPWGWKPTPSKSRGLGDTIAKITTALGITPCGGCKGRQELLNKLVPYKPKPET